LTELAGLVALTPEDLLDLLSAELVKGPVVVPDVQALTAAEIDSLAKAGVDLSGPPEGAEPQVSTTGELIRLLSDALDTESTAQVLKVTPGRVRQRLAARQLYGVRVGNSWRIPRWQFSGHGTVPGLEYVIAAMPKRLHPLGVEHVMTTPSPDLSIAGQAASPLSWLVSGGDPQAVVRLVADLPTAP